MRSVLLVAALMTGLPVLAQLGGAIKAGVIKETRGNVAGQAGKGKPQLLKRGQSVQPGMVIDSAAGSDTVLAFPDGQIGVLGSKGTVRLNNYAYDPDNPKNSDINLNLVEGNLRVVMGEIGLSNPAALHLQVGTASVALQSSSKTSPADASLVSIDGAIAVSVREGRLEVRLPDGSVLQVAAGQTLMLSQDGTRKLDTTAKMMQSLGDSPLGLQVQSQLAESQGFSKIISETQVTLAAVTAALKDPAAKNAAAREVLALLENLEAPAQIAPAPAPAAPTPRNNTANTPTTGASGGGTPCTASCN